MSNNIVDLNIELETIEDKRLEVKIKSNEIDNKKDDLHNFMNKLASAYDYVAEGYQGSNATSFLQDKDNQMREVISTELHTLDEQQEELEYEIQKLYTKENDIVQKKIELEREENGNDI